MDGNYWTRKARRVAGQGLNRRGFIAGAGAAAFLMACGSDDKETSQATTGPSGTTAAGAQPGGTAAAQATAVPKGGTVTTVIIGTDGKSFHQGQTSDAPSSTYQGNVYDNDLLRYNPETLAIEGNAAAKFEQSADKKTVTFTLKDMKWSDGQPVTAGDYVWSYEQLLKPENKYPYSTNLTPLESVVAVDAKTLKVTVKEPIAVLENWDVIPAFPKHIWEKYDWNDPVKNPEISTPTVGNGPFKLKEWKKDQFATFVRNDTYWDGAPNIEQHTYKVFGTAALAFQALKSGEVDYNQSVQPADYKELKSLSNVNVYEWYRAAGAWNYIGFNFRRKPLQDLNVRRAIAYATDRKGIIDSLAYGLGRPLYSVYPQSSWAYNPNVEKYEFDTKKAADHFKAAGYTISDKKLMKDGQQLKLKMLYNTGNNVREGIATLMKQQLEELGASVDVQGIEFQAYLDALKKEPYDYDLFVLGWNATLEPHFMQQIWTESQIPALNSGAYVNKQVEQLFIDGSKEFDREKRKAIYGQIQKILADDLPYVFLYEGLQFAGVSKKIGGIKPSKIGITYNINQWHVTR
jgi:peptide/nickel transport system substrate-binding protein